MPVWRLLRRRNCSAVGRGAPAGASNTMKSLPAPCIFVNSMRMGERITESEQSGSGSIPVQASIHDRKDARPLCLLGGRYVNDAVLQPQCRQPQADAVL